jgi:putative PIG3 family NAD(P)H quinone oxidoreductase
MKVVRITTPGGPEVLRLEELPAPEAGRGEVRVRVRAAALNRADLMQRRGQYPAPPGAPDDVPGLEYAGHVAEVGDGVRGLEPGDRVMGLLGGGGYAQEAVVPAGMALPVPDGLSLVEAAAVPEAFITAYDALFRRAAFGAGERVLIHSAGGGVGTAALQLARAAGASLVVGTASGPKLEAIRDADLPLDVGVDYREEDFAEAVDRHTGGDGVDVILDTVGADYWDRNVASLARRGRMVLVGLLGGRRAEVDLGAVLRRRLTVVGTVLRSRPVSEKIELTREVRRRVLPLFDRGELRPVVDRTWPLAEAAEAHAYMEANRNFGKIVLEVG